ncbi:MAG TPA: AMP-binding protein [Rudaea sp.]|nr:AMP-binding protein [Rudaea sp.]
MSAVFQPDLTPRAALPLLADGDLQRALILDRGQTIDAARFIGQAQALAARLPAGSHAVNLCENRYEFLVAFCAVILAGQTNLLPASRAPRAIADVLHAYPASYALGDRAHAAQGRHFELPVLADLDAEPARDIPVIAGNQIVAIGFTSGSTGTPKANAKTWASVRVSSAMNAAVLGADTAALNLVATVPPQHMYGLEMSVLLPLLSRAAIHSGQPFFPADIAQALAATPAPRVLVTTPIHLRALLRDGAALPPLQAIVTATAPLEQELAAEAERQFAAPVIEVFGSTETCVIAHRRTVHDEPWHLYSGVELHPQPDGTLVQAPHFAAPTLLQDIVELLPSRQFVLRGRNSDLLEIAGKRASLGDLNRRLLAIAGVEDGVVFALDAESGSVGRLAALVVAPALPEAEILAALRTAVDPVFLPRPLRRVSALPRNSTGKLPRDALLQALRE